MCHSGKSHTSYTLLADYLHIIIILYMFMVIQEAFKTPMVRVGSHRVKLQTVIPELLFNDFAPELLFRTTFSAPDMFLLSLEEHMNGGIPPPEDTGRYLRLYYTQENEDHNIMKIAGAEKAVSHDALFCEIAKFCKQ